MALKKCEPEVLNYHLVRFDIFFGIVNLTHVTNTHAHKVVYEIEVFIPDGGSE